MVLGQNAGSATPELLLAPEDLNKVSKSHSDFLALLAQRGQEKGITLKTN